jgi:hypothetical protein
MQTAGSDGRVAGWTPGERLTILTRKKSDAEVTKFYTGIRTGLLRMHQ